MKLIIKIVMPFAMFSAGLIPAQSQQNLNGAIQHVIVVIQENRTPDNLFHEDTMLVNHGADVIPANQTLQTACKSGPVSMAPVTLAPCWDPDHSHGEFPGSNYEGAWTTTYDGGLMDGACNVKITGFGPTGYCTKIKQQAPPCYNNNSCPYTYADNVPILNGPGVLQPYFDMANEYGFANYAFQTNQGPSFEAHQFLFSGTSAPTDNQNDKSCVKGDGKPCYKWFASELHTPGSNDSLFGCPDTNGDIAEVDSSDSLNDFLNVYQKGVPCYSHNSIADLLDDNGVTWGYYPQGPNPGSSLWTAPNAISSICGLSGGKCNGQIWNASVAPYIPPPPTQNLMAPVLTDIANCTLPNVSFVIPDGSWSDHAGTSDGSTPAGDYGPSWVSAIVNAVGLAKPACLSGEVLWSNTVIIVVWDDWGGWYDHVLPWRCDTSGNCNGYSNGDGGTYVYGFRVPMLVISAYNKHATNNPDGYTGYISGACGQVGQPSCPYYGPTSSTSQYVHDFGSILNFIEYAFGTDGNFLSLPGSQNLNKGISPGYAYADVLAPDSYLSNNPGCPQQAVCPYSLSDFFVTGPWTSPAPFVPITSYVYPPGVFENWGVNDGNVATDPDADAYETSLQ